MKCAECGGTYVERHGDLTLNDDKLGAYTIHDSNYFECDKCGEYLFPATTCNKIDEAILELK
jgi:YgiT-type zinc finger domain-containing protein